MYRYFWVETLGGNASVHENIAEIGKLSAVREFGDDLVEIGARDVDMVWHDRGTHLYFIHLQFEK